MMNEAKQTNFRLNPEDAEKFRQQAEENGLNQAEMFATLLNAYEASKTAAQLPDRAGEIKAFTQLANDLYTLFLGSLTVSRAEKEKQIEGLTKELEAKEADYKKLAGAIEELKEKLHVQEQIEEEKSRECDLLSANLAEAEAEKEEKEETIQAQNRQLAVLNDLVDESKELKTEYKKLSENVESERREKERLKQENSSLGMQLENNKEIQDFYKNQLESLTASQKETEERHRLELERRDQENRDKIEMLEKQYQERIKLLQEKEEKA